MARRAFRPGAAAIAQKRLTVWLSIPPVNNTVTATGGTISSSLNAAALALRPFTIVRTRYLLNVASDQEAATEGYSGALGLCVVSDQASAIGITAVPTPITDMGSDLWFLHQVWAARELHDTSAGLGANVGYTTEIDSKAMRKVDIGEDVLIVLESNVGVTGGGTIVVHGGRMLVKLH